jgi:HEAT repeat protein
LREIALTSDNNAILDTAIVAVGKSASNNRSDQILIRRFVTIVSEHRAPWLHSRVSRTLGQLAAVQALPDEAFSQLNAIATEPNNAIQGKHALSSLIEIGATSTLPMVSLDILTNAFETDSNRYVRVAIIKALANNATQFPRAVELIRSATNIDQRSRGRAERH